MNIDSQAYLVLVKVIDRVEVPEERITYQKQVGILAWQSTLVDHEVALALVRLVEILLRVDFEDVVRHLEAHWLDFGGDFLARLCDVAESLVRFAVELW